MYHSRDFLEERADPRNNTSFNERPEMTDTGYLTTDSIN